MTTAEQVKALEPGETLTIAGRSFTGTAAGFRLYSKDGAQSAEYPLHLATTVVEMLGSPACPA